MDAFDDIAIPPFSFTAPVIKEVEFVASPTKRTPDKFALEENVFHLSVDEPKLYPVVPGIKASVPAESLIVTKVNAPAGVDPGENEALYPVKEIVLTASPLIDIDSVPTPALSFQ